jgi:hypothetical protein
VSESALGKEDVIVPSLSDRIEVLEAVASSRPWLGVRVTPFRLLADIAAGYDALVVGADKWAQLLDPSWYGGSEAAHHAGLARLPTVMVAARGATEISAPPPAFTAALIRLDVDAAVQEMSSTAVRAGRREWMLPEASEWDRRHRGWSDPAAYAAGRQDRS